MCYAVQVAVRLAVSFKKIPNYNSFARGYQAPRQNEQQLCTKEQEQQTKQNSQNNTQLKTEMVPQIRQSFILR